MEENRKEKKLHHLWSVRASSSSTELRVAQHLIQVVSIGEQRITPRLSRETRDMYEKKQQHSEAQRRGEAAERHLCSAATVALFVVGGKRRKTVKSQGRRLSRKRCEVRVGGREGPGCSTTRVVSSACCFCVWLLLLDGVFCLVALLFLFLVMRRLAAAASLFSPCCGSAAGGCFATWSLHSDLIST